MRERKKIQRNLGGVRNMTKLPGALVVIDTNREKNALLEAKSLGIPTVCLVDTDGDPDLVNIPIPGNDDSMRTIDIVIRELCEAIKKGKEGRSTSAGESPVSDGRERGEGRERADRGDRRDDSQRRRSSRSTFRADGPSSPAAAAAEVSVAGSPDAGSGPSA
jgi:small subunit ribosomal protein S2